MSVLIPSKFDVINGNLICPKVNYLVEEKIKVARSKNVKTAGVADIVGELTGLELISTDKNCGGYYDRTNNVIALKDYKTLDPNDYWSVHKVTKERIDLVEQQKIVICHEIGHALQAQVEKFEVHDNLLSWGIQLEWEAESISYKIYNSVFGKLPVHWFGAYFNIADLQFLKEHHSGWLENDVNL